MKTLISSRVNIFMILVGFLISCSQDTSLMEPTVNSSQTPQPKQIVSDPEDTLTPSVTSPTTSTKMPQPLATATPSITPTPSMTPLPTIAPNVTKYLDEAFTIMYENSIRRDEINWEIMRSRYEAKIRAVQPETIEEAHYIINQAVDWLDDGHSLFLAADEVTSWHSERTIDPSWFDAEFMQNGYGYISIPAFSSGSEAIVNEFATLLQEVIAEIDSQQPCGWIVDLRQNHGGNMWPMIAGIGPILGEGEFGANIRADDSKIIWYYEDGKAWWGEELLAQTNEEAITLHKEFPPIAILINDNTASAGEAVAIAFKERPQTRFFGQPTAGFTTANEPYYLSDGSIIFLSDSYMGDRTGRAYKSSVAPDEEWDSRGSLDVPIEWLATQPSCN